MSQFSFPLYQARVWPGCCVYWRWTGPPVLWCSHTGPAPPVLQIFLYFTNIFFLKAPPATCRTPPATLGRWSQSPDQQTDINFMFCFGKLQSKKVFIKYVLDLHCIQRQLCLVNINKAKCLLDAVETPMFLLHGHILYLIGLHHVVAVKLELSRIFYNILPRYGSNQPIGM